MNRHRRDLLLRFLALLALLAVGALTGCAAPPDADDAAASELSLASNCSFIPGCKHLLEASDGPFVASVMTYEDGAGALRRRLSISYREAPEASFLLCSRFPRQPELGLVFVIGPEGARESIRRPMAVACPRSYGDNPGATNTASFSVVEDADGELWETLFPTRPDGTRWFALRLAAVNADGSWDSRAGDDYRLVLRPRGQ